MWKTLLLQAVAILAVAVGAGMVSGFKGAQSALIGGTAYFLPSALFVLRLQAGIAVRRVSAVGFLFAEAVKLCMVIALLVMLPRMMDVSWPAMIAGLFAVLFVNLFALLLKT